MKNVILSVLLLACGLVSPAFSELTTVDGKPVAGVVQSVSYKDVILLVDGKSATVKLKQLTEASQAEAISTAKAGKTWDPYPPLTIQVQVPTKRRPQGSAWYMKTMSIEPKVVITGSSSLEPIPAAEAVLLIVTMDTRAKYTSGKEKYVVQTAEKLPIPAAFDGKRRQFDFKPCEVSYDSYRDKTNVGGFVYKYFVFALREPETGRIIDFQTNQVELQKMGIINPGKITEILALKASSPFPTDFK